MRLHSLLQLRKALSWTLKIMVASLAFYLNQAVVPAAVASYLVCTPTLSLD